MELIELIKRLRIKIKNMSTAELKEKVLKKIEQITEDYLLEEVLGMIEIETSDELFEIPNEHMKDIEIGLAQIENGNTIPLKEVKKNVQEWLDK